MINIYASIYAIHKMGNYYSVCTHAESLNTSQVLERQKMEGGSVSVGTLSGSQSGQRKVPQLGCPGKNAQEMGLWVDGALAHKSSELCHSRCHCLWVSWRDWGLTPPLTPNKSESASKYRNRREQTPQEILAH